MSSISSDNRQQKKGKSRRRKAKSREEQSIEMISQR